MSRKIGYNEIANHYRQQIQDGTLAPGDALPPMSKVCETFNVAITTANRAYRLLKSEGLTLAMPGVGTVVADMSEAPATASARLERIARTGERYAPGETSAQHQARLAAVNVPLIQNLLELDPHDEVVLRTRVFLRDGKPRVVAVSCIKTRALADVPELLQQEPFERFWQEIYTERTGKKITKSPERRTARFASTDEMKALGIDTETEAVVPVLVLVNVFHDEHGPLEYWEDVYAPGTWQIDSK